MAAGKSRATPIIFYTDRQPLTQEWSADAAAFPRRSAAGGGGAPAGGPGVRSAAAQRQGVYCGPRIGYARCSVGCAGRNSRSGVRWCGEAIAGGGAGGGAQVFRHLGAVRRDLQSRHGAGA
eukprot:ctg_433.g270